MVRKKETAAEYIEGHDGVMRIILGELVENAGAINLWWITRGRVVRTDPDRAESPLVDAEIHPNHHVRLELPARELGAIPVAEFTNRPIATQTTVENRSQGTFRR